MLICLVQNKCVDLINMEINIAYCSMKPDGHWHLINIVFSCIILFRKYLQTSTRLCLVETDSFVNIETNGSQMTSARLEKFGNLNGDLAHFLYLIVFLSVLFSFMS